MKPKVRVTQDNSCPACLLINCKHTVTV